jgi:RimJ/RimL family protein N-acetyltransferase
MHSPAVAGLLREVTDEDLPVFFEQQRDPESVAMAAFPPRELEPFFAHWHRIMDDDALIAKTIVSDGEVAGNVVSFERDGKQLVGYWLGREYWGRGLATRALAELLEELTIRPLYAEVATANIGSIRVLEKCGFTVVGSETEQTEEFGELELLVMELVG